MAVNFPTFNNNNQQPYNQQQGYQMFNPHTASMAGGIGTMNNLGGMLGQAFAGANRQNSSNRVNNNAINAASGGGGGGGGGVDAMAVQYDFMKELMRQQSENQRQQQKMQMAQQLMGMMGGMQGGPQLAGFGSNFGQGVNLFGTPPAAGTTPPGGTPAPTPTPGQPGGNYGPYMNPFDNDVMGQQLNRINSLRNRTAGPGQHPRMDSHYGMNLAMGSRNGTTAGIPPMNMMAAGGRNPGFGDNPIGGGKPRRPAAKPTFNTDV